LKNGKKSSRLTEVEINTINPILINCAIKIHEMSSVKLDELCNRLWNFIESDKDVASALLFVNILDMKAEKLYSPKQLNQKLANMKPVNPPPDDSSVSIRVQETKYVSDSQLTKALGPLVKGGFLTNITTKKELKDFISEQRKAGRKAILQTTGGRTSFYHTSPSLNNLKELMLQDKIRYYLFDSLKRSGLLLSFIELFFKAHINLLTNDKFFEYLKTANQHLGLKKEEWESGKNFFQSLDDKQIRKVAVAIVEAIPMMENLNLFRPHYILYSILKI